MDSNIKNEDSEILQDDDESDDEQLDTPDIEISKINNLTMNYLSGKVTLEEYQNLFEDVAKKEVDDEVDEQIVEMQFPCHERVYKKPRKLKKALAGLMGEANMKYASGCLDEAVKISMEVIRNAPNVPDPYHLLSVIYDELGQIDKSMQYNLVAAQLSKTDVDEWLNVAEKSITLNNFVLAMFCYERACRLEPNNEKLWKDKCDLMEKASLDKKKILESYKHLLSIMTVNNNYIDLARRIFTEFHLLGESKKAIETFTMVLNLHPKIVSASDINLLIDIYFLEKNFVQPLSLLEKHCGVKITKSDDDIPVNISLTSTLPVDLLAKLLICLIHLKHTDILQPILAHLYAENIEEVGDLYLDVAEAYITEHDYTHAEELLQLLINTNNYNLAAVWLRYAECLKLLNKLDKAVYAYKRVIEMASDHVEARICLSNLHQQLGNYEEAVQVLQSKPGSQSDLSECNVQLLFKQCFILHEQGKVDDFINCSLKVLRICCEQIFVPTYTPDVLSNRSARVRPLVYHHTSGLNNVNNVKEIPSLMTMSEDIWNLYKTLCRRLCEFRLYEKLDEITILMLLCPPFLHDQLKSSELEFICLISGLLNRNSFFAYSILRLKLIKVLDNNRMWNIFGQIIAMSQDIRHNKFCIRLAMKHPDNLPLCILNGHNALVAGSYKHALGEYFACLRTDIYQPFYYLLIGISFSHMVSQKFSSHRHILSIQAFGFLYYYLKIRGKCQETFYNIGRAMHQMGLLFLAISFYEMALSCDPVLGEEECFDLRHEIAYNLYLIYMSSNSHQMASYVLENYLTI